MNFMLNITAVSDKCIQFMIYWFYIILMPDKLEFIS